jgi:hypothetical protein
MGFATASPMVNHNVHGGICNGFTDGQSQCAWWEYARNEMFWVSFLFAPFLFLASIVWIIMAAVQFVVGMKQKRKNNGV